MKMKGLKFLVTFMTVLCFAGTAFAASGNQVDMKTDIPTIPISACDRAGFISFEIGNGFTMTEGDIIQLNLTNLVTACKDVDYFMVLATADGQTFPAHTVTGEAVTTSTGGTNLLNTLQMDGGAFDFAEYAIGFLVRANATTSRATIQLARYDLPGGVAINDGEVSVLNDTNLSFQITFDVDTGGGGLATDLLTVRLFDAKDTAGTPLMQAPANFLKDDPTTNNATLGYVDYVIDIVAEDNVLCIDTDDPDVVFSDGQYVRATPQSIPAAITGRAPTPLTFSGDNTVATISGQTGYTISDVGKGTCPEVTILPEVNQFGEEIGNITDFDMGTYPAGFNYQWLLPDYTSVCADDPNDSDSGRGVIITRNTTFSASEEFRVTVSLATMAPGATDYVDAPATKAWWDDGVSVSDGIFYTSASNVGNVDPSGGDVPASGVGFSFLVDTDTEVDGDTRWGAARTGWFTPGDPAAAGIADPRDSIMIDLSAIDFDKSAFVEGETLVVKVMVERFPCGQVIEDYVCVFIASECSTTTASSYNLTFPYGVGANNAAFWTGIAITNLTDTEGTATVMFYGTDGGQSSYDVTVAAYGITSFAMSAIMDDLGGTLTGDENFFAIVDAPFAADGIMFVGGKGANTVLHGYLPRVH